MLGHMELTTTEIYTRVSINLLRQVYSATHPAAHLKRPETSATTARDAEAQAELCGTFTAEPASWAQRLQRVAARFRTT
jgi:integrase/recombinase XerD